MNFPRFGTDGIRGIVYQDLTLAYVGKIALSYAKALNSKYGQCTVLIGRDTRKSGVFLEPLIASVLTSLKINVVSMGITSTPALSHAITESHDYVGGIMITASHNPKEYNGLKFFGEEGLKISKEFQTLLELNIKDNINLDVDLNYGSYTFQSDLNNSYCSHIQSLFPNNFLSDIKVGLDCANGSTSVLAKDIFSSLGANVFVISDSISADNINDNCGSTHPKRLSTLVKKENLDIGFAFDGDGDRVIMVDDNGNIVTGDGILYILANYFNDNDNLFDKTIVATIMTNQGLINALENCGIKSLIVGVGDTNVSNAMDDNNLVLGGEDSGHIIAKDYSQSGDGILIALLVCLASQSFPSSLGDTLNEIAFFPSTLENIEVVDKERIMTNNNLNTFIKECEEQLGNNGRISVRASGTEHLIRILVEAKTKALCTKYINIIKNEIKKIAL